MASAIERYQEFHFSSDLGNERRRAVARWRILELLREKLVARTLDSESASERLDSLADEVARRQRDPYSAVDELIKEKQSKQVFIIYHLLICHFQLSTV